jgi:hypothetical protein
MKRSPPLSRAQSLTAAAVSAAAAAAAAAAACRTGVIPAPEFADRFFSIFTATPGSIRHELFMQLALLVPLPAKRLELLQHAQNVRQFWVIIRGRIL